MCSERINILLISADFPNIISGIGDYAFHLFSNFKKAQYNTYLISTDDGLIHKQLDNLYISWSLKDFYSVIKYVMEKDIEIVNIQYPGVLYGKYNLSVHLLCVILNFMGQKVVTTLHEFSNVNILRRFSELVFLVFSDVIIFTNFNESQNSLLLRIFKKKIRVVPIFPNIEFETPISSNNSKEIIYFGMVYRDKMLERVIDTMSWIDESFQAQFHFKFLVGNHIRQLEYYFKVREYAKKKMINQTWLENLPINGIKSEIEGAFIAVLYYNDGISIRRGSALAIIASGIPIITNRSSKSSDFDELVNKGVFYCDGIEEIISTIVNLKSDVYYYKACTQNLRMFSQKYSLEKAVKSYINIFNELLEI